MRFALLALCLAGCFDTTSDDDYYYDDSGWGSGYGGSSGPVTSGCQKDADCGATLVCARTFECLDASQVHAIHTTWTVNGQAASTTSCKPAPMLAITFSGVGGNQWGYAPVPCTEGKFTVDKMPLGYTHVQLANEPDYAGGASGTFDAQGTVSLDLPYY
jgi:hypothetical protein